LDEKSFSSKVALARGDFDLNDSQTEVNSLKFMMVLVCISSEVFRSQGDLKKQGRVCIEDTSIADETSSTT